MPYPFDDNMLERHLLEMRRLESEELVLRADLAAAVKGEASGLASALSDVQARIKLLRYASPLEPRSYDVFMTSLELALREFETCNPKPIRRARHCEHPVRRRVVRTFRNHSKHLCYQCIDCGSKLGDMKKSYWPDWTQWGSFDEQLFRADSQAMATWEAALSEVFAAADKSDGIPRFDWSKFSEDYEVAHPKPFDPGECKHVATSLRRRRYGPRAGDAVVQQCLDCGKHLKSVSKTSVPDIESLADFDERRKATSGSAMSCWRAAYGDALEEARLAFRVELGRQIAAGAIQDVDRSRFGTYYATSQWRSTRERILRRDDHACQACGTAATRVHHMTYDRLGCENDLDLISLCGPCHGRVHMRQDACAGLRLTPNEIRMLTSDDA